SGLVLGSPRMLVPCKPSGKPDNHQHDPEVPDTSKPRKRDLSEEVPALPTIGHSVRGQGKDRDEKYAEAERVDVGSRLRVELPSDMDGCPDAVDREKSRWAGNRSHFREAAREFLVHRGLDVASRTR